MESLQHIQSRLKAVKNVGKITKAMEVVAATKMRKAQEVALRTRPFAFRALALLQKVSEQTFYKTPLSIVRPAKKTLLLIVSSDRGLAGSFNAQILRVADTFRGVDDIEVITIGKKAHAYVQKNKLREVTSYFGFGDYADFNKIKPLSDILIGGYLDGQWDKVITISTHFESTLKQNTLVRQILPVDFKKIKETAEEIIPKQGRYANLQDLIVGNDNGNGSADYIFEPSVEQAIDTLVPFLVSMQMYHLVLEANASEHSARMVAMKTASDNAKDLSLSLNLDYNKARQAAITQEIIEIVSTQNAL